MARIDFNRVHSVVLSCAETASKLIHELHQRDPDHSTFDQVGLLDGLDSVIDSLQNGYEDLAVETLLYMIHEAAIDFPVDRVRQIHEIAELIGADNWYTKASVEALPPERRRHVYNTI